MVRRYYPAVHIELMRDASNEFPALASPGEVTSLRVWHCKYRSLAELARLRNVEGLVVATYPDATLEPLRHLRSLRYLRLLHLPKVSALDPLAEVVSLEVLSISTLPSWDASGKVTEVESLRPMARLPLLRHLELFGVRPPDRSLRELEVCPSLETLRVSKYPKPEVERFRRVRSVTNDFAPEPWF